MRGNGGFIRRGRGGGISVTLRVNCLPRLQTTQEDKLSLTSLAVYKKKKNYPSMSDSICNSINV